MFFIASAFADEPAHAHHCGSARHGFADAEHWATVFDDPARDAWQKPDALVAALPLARGMVVADVGAGTGYLNRRLATAVGKKGKLIAVDIEPSLVCHMARRALKEQTMNVEPRLGQAADPMLGPAEVDLVLMVDTYHHIEDRGPWFSRLAAAVEEGGRLVVVDFKAGELPVGPGPDHKIAPEVVDAELAAVGWRRVEAHDSLLPYQFVHVYAR